MLDKVRLLISGWRFLFLLWLLCVMVPLYCCQTKGPQFFSSMMYWMENLSKNISKFKVITGRWRSGSSHISLTCNIIICSIKALPVSLEKSPAETSVKAQTHANDWNNHPQSDAVVFVLSLTLIPLSSSTLPHPSSQSPFVFLNHSEFVLCVLKRPSVCRDKRRRGGGLNRDTAIQCDKSQENVEIWGKKLTAASCTVF